jgi:hypothetical protein
MKYLIILAMISIVLNISFFSNVHLVKFYGTYDKTVGPIGISIRISEEESSLILCFDDDVGDFLKDELKITGFENIPDPDNKSKNINLSSCLKIKIVFCNLITDKSTVMCYIKTESADDYVTISFSNFPQETEEQKNFGQQIIKSRKDFIKGMRMDKKLRKRLENEIEGDFFNLYELEKLYICLNLEETQNDKIIYLRRQILIHLKHNKSFYDDDVRFILDNNLQVTETDQVDLIDENSSPEPDADTTLTLPIELEDDDESDFEPKTQLEDSIKTLLKKTKNTLSKQRNSGYGLSFFFITKSTGIEDTIIQAWEEYINLAGFDENPEEQKQDKSKLQKMMEPVYAAWVSRTIYGDYSHIDHVLRVISKKANEKQKLNPSNLVKLTKEINNPNGNTAELCLLDIEKYKRRVEIYIKESLLDKLEVLLIYFNQPK